MKLELYPIFWKNDAKNVQRSDYLVLLKRAKGKRRVLKSFRLVFLLDFYFIVFFASFF